MPYLWLIVVLWFGRHDYVGLLIFWHGVFFCLTCVVYWSMKIDEARIQEILMVFFEHEIRAIEQQKEAMLRLEKAEWHAATTSRSRRLRKT